MRIENHRLMNNGGTPVTFVPAAHAGEAIHARFIVMHYTAGGKAESTVRYFASPSARASAHFVIARDGAVTQQVSCDRAAWHAGRSSWHGLAGLNGHSIGIELANWGLLSRGPSGHVSYTGTPVSGDLVIVAAHKNEPGVERAWEMFPEAQIEAAANVAAAIADAYGIGEDAILGHDDISPRRKIDPGPAFDMRGFRARVAGRGASEGDEAPLLRVSAHSGLNLRSGAGLSHPVIALLPEGACVRAIGPDTPSLWRLVALARNGLDGITGYAHEHWLMEM